VQIIWNQLPSWNQTYAKLAQVKMTKDDHIQARIKESKMSNPYLSFFLSFFISLKERCFKLKIFVTNQLAGFSGFAMNRDRLAGTVVKVAD
jgi:hypothetical protein